MADCKKYNGSTWEHSLRKLTISTDTFTTLPAVIYPNDTTATVGLKGNTVQNGTPTPDNPVMPQGTGERTGNLLDKTEFTGVSATIEQIKDGIHVITTSGGYAARIILDVLQNTDYTISYIWKRISGVPANNVRVFAGTGDSTQIAMFEYKTGGTFNTGNNTKINIWFYAAFGTVATVEYTKIMLNSGSTALPYEPYGVKIPISSANTTTPVYLGEVETTRKIKKLVLTGRETAWSSVGGNAPYRIMISDIIQTTDRNAVFFVCSHFESVSNNVSWAQYSSCVSWAFSGNTNVECVQFRDVNQTTLADFKSYLAQQYAAGTPVTVWYVLATEETGIVNEPLMKIGDYADEVSGITIPVTAGGETLSVDTTLQPSEVTVNYKGWHPVADVHERDNGQWT